MRGKRRRRRNIKWTKAVHLEFLIAASFKSAGSLFGQPVAGPLKSTRIFSIYRYQCLTTTIGNWTRVGIGFNTIECI